MKMGKTCLSRHRDDFLVSLNSSQGGNDTMYCYVVVAGGEVIMTPVFSTDQLILQNTIQHDEVKERFYRYVAKKMKRKMIPDVQGTIPPGKYRGRGEQFYRTFGGAVSCTPSSVDACRSKTHGKKCTTAEVKAGMVRSQKFNAVLYSENGKVKVTEAGYFADWAHKFPIYSGKPCKLMDGGSWSCK